jgi:hypothetical protein
MSHPLFSTGTARGGTGLFAHMLSAHSAIRIASDPLLALYKSFRNAAVGAAAQPLMDTFDLESPLGDGYFTAERRMILDLIERADLSLPVAQSEWPRLRETLKRRGLLASADLVPHMDALSGDTYRAAFESSLAMIERARPTTVPLQWVGIHDNWTVDFFSPLARAFPDARFAIVIRDPRAVFSSSLKEPDQTKVGNLVSYARCHRKLMAYAAYLQTLPLFRNRLFVIRYEDLLIDPEGNCRKLCAFLGVDFEPGMLDTTTYINYATGGVHDGMSNFETNAQGFVPARIDRWKAHLSPQRVDLIDLLCGPEMALWGYGTERIRPSDPMPSSCLATMIDEMTQPCAWRVDFQDPLRDLGFELFRREMLNGHAESGSATDDVIRRCFLFPEVFARLTAATGPS